ncbi:MAG TPA: M23 family metallopeptidase [Leptospiraceae bacterium]|nr:M23 family metallopeptidase [Leptospiraceae bacterium]HMW07365.1 M23 family metallopeptidase [Leptospiraceae bacterium]HMX34782.1 M23 family metallopeptidase [Leptospiraceae bacterium]HMY32429.1 M23 family metallopeptidase [Leptospiraceae bacterium]HNE09026.1 M23 family metallopeptidase [Leptospiraceae bacterium]
MKKISILFLLLPLCFLLSQDKQKETLPAGFIWPVGGENLEVKLSSLFGESRGDHFHNGVDVSSDNEKVSSIEKGTVIYSHYNSDNPFENESGSGNSVWVLHDNDILSAYYHLKDGRSLEVLEKKVLEKGDSVGKTGNTGHSSGSHLHFVVATDKGRKIIDPLRILPKVKDTRPPSIGSLILTIGKNMTYINDGDSFNSSSNFPITVDISDAGERKGQRRGVKTLRFSLNNKIIKESNFNELTLVNGKWQNENGLSFNDLFYENNYYLGDLKFLSGDNTVSITAIDYNNNKTEKSFTFFVNKIRKK